MKRNISKSVALGGILAAVAVGIMCLGGIIPLATYSCPVLCIVAQALVLQFCGKRIAWAWYGAVSFLALFLGPDKEAAAVFLMLGYYPIIKPKMDSVRVSFLWKLLHFNTSIVLLYSILIRVMGLENAMEDFGELGMFGLCIILVLGNVTFILVDQFLNMMGKKMR